MAPPTGRGKRVSKLIGRKLESWGALSIGDDVREGFYLGDTGYCPWTLRLSQLEVSVPNHNWGKKPKRLFGGPLFPQSVVHGPAVKSSMNPGGKSSWSWTLGPYLRTHDRESTCELEF